LHIQELAILRGWQGNMAAGADIKAPALKHHCGREGNGHLTSAALIRAPHYHSCCRSNAATWSNLKMSDGVFSSIARKRAGRVMYLLMMFINGKFRHRAFDIR